MTCSNVATTEQIIHERN
jgi:hypothetical protein